MRKISSDEATIDDAFAVAQLMIEEGNTEQGVQLLRAAEIALVRAEGDRTKRLIECAIRGLIKRSSPSSSASGSKPSPTRGMDGSLPDAHRPRGMAASLNRKIVSRRFASRVSTSSANRFSSLALAAASARAFSFAASGLCERFFPRVPSSAPIASSMSKRSRERLKLRKADCSASVRRAGMALR
jgi:hypothetical protein